MNYIKIGKNAIENLTIGMYKDSKIIYREYIQNAADQIDYAIKHNMFNEKLNIDIKIDAKNRTIIIRDNATGVQKDKIVSTLADVADSDKKVGENKGFRGIGRLGGLAYCEQLRFITSYKGENTKSIMTWNAKALIRMINDRSVKEDAATVLESIISYEYEQCEEDEHYFAVELIGVNPENTELLDVEEVKKYISINAPVPYNSKLIYKEMIYQYLKERSIPTNEYIIYVNCEDITKSYTTTLYKNVSGQKNKYDEIYDIKIEEFTNDNGELLAWMWYGISSFVNRIPSSVNDMAGIRLRQSNIQIGDANTLVPLFKEDRGNFYFIGEVHAVHPKLVPNARRDNFNENETRVELEQCLTDYFRKTLHQLYYDANKAKSAYNKEFVLKKLEESHYKKNGKFVDNKEREKLEQAIEKAKIENEKAKKEIDKLTNKAEGNNIFKKVLENVENDYEKKLKENGFLKEKSERNLISNTQKDNPKKRGTFLVDELSKLNDKQRKLVSRIYAIISNNLPSDESDALINKIQEELKR